MKHISAKWEEFGSSPALLSPWLTRAISTTPINDSGPSIILWDLHSESVMRLSFQNPLGGSLSSPGRIVCTASMQSDTMELLWRYQETSKSLWYSSLCLSCSFCKAWTSQQHPKQQKKREGISICAQMCYSINRQPSSYKNAMGKRRKIHTKCSSVLPLLHLFHPDEVMLVVHGKARLQWANLIFHTCLFICWKPSLCRSADGLETDIKTGL